MSSHYFSQPSLYTPPRPEGSPEGLIVFVCDDDLWSVPLAGGRAYRLTSNLGIVAEPCLSPDGLQIAFAGSEGGQKDLYLMPRNGGPAERLTYIGIHKFLGWKDSETLLLSSSYESQGVRTPWLFEFRLSDRSFHKIPYGPASDLVFSREGRALLGRHCRDSALWKRYRGGTAGVFWVQDQQGRFRRILSQIEYNLTNPQWIGSSIYFLSDFEGIAQIYRCTPEGRQIKALTQSREFYIRNLKTDGRQLVYQCGGEIYISDLEGNSRQVEIELSTPAIQAQPRFENAMDYLESYCLNPKGDELCLITRGHGYRMKPWSGGVTEIAGQNPLRMKCPTYFDEGRKILFARSTHAEDESLHIFDNQTRKIVPFRPDDNWGKIWEIKINPKREIAVLCNNRNEIFALDLKKSSVKKIEASKVGRMSEVSFSPDGRYLVYTAHLTSERSGLRIYDFETENLRWICTPVHSDWSGSFDQSGEYFYFLSIREFYPNYNATHFDLGFPFAGRPFVITLRQDGRSPFHQFPDLDAHQVIPTKTPEKNENTSRRNTSKRLRSSGAKSSTPVPDEGVKVQIDWENLENRIEALPVRIGGYGRLVGLDKRLFYTRSKITPSRDFSMNKAEADSTELLVYNFEKQKEEVFAATVKSFALNADRTQICYHSKNSLRLVSTKELPREGQGSDKIDGWIRTDRVRLQVHPRAEWRQMYREAWELQKEHFWDPRMSAVNWKLVYDRYLPLLEKVVTRSEMSDLLWEMQGELGTSHCYEYMGDYFRRPPLNPVGFLGGQFKFKPKEKAFEILQLFSGDAWLEGHSSPLLGTRAGLKAGDLILAIDGWRMEDPQDLGRRLLNKAGVDVNLEILRKGQKNPENISVRTLRTQGPALYREWVEANRQRVHRLSKGRVGYVHIPNMMTAGYSEFYRGFLAEYEKDGLIVDVRYNGGGHVSQHILKVLNQKVLGYDQSRWNGVMKYPTYAINGPIVALTNESAGSDGDIFSHSFKLMKIGPLIGKRTWGGVIGINGQYSLMDGTTTTQPEYSFWFKDVGWAVENYGTDPDIEVEFPPEAYARGEDPQIERAVAECLRLARKTPPLPANLHLRPDLSLPVFDASKSSKRVKTRRRS